MAAGMQRKAHRVMPGLPVAVDLPVMPQTYRRAQRQQIGSELPDQTRSERVVRSAGVTPGSNPRRPVRPTREAEKTVSSIVAAGQQGPEQHEPDNGSGQSSGSSVVGQWSDGTALRAGEFAPLFGGTTGSGKSPRLLLLLAQLQRHGARIRVMDPKGAHAREFFGMPGMGE